MQRQENQERDLKNNKEYPMALGLLAYFPDALRETSNVSFKGNEKHNKGEPLHWSKEKSSGHADALIRHLTEHLKGNIYDEDGATHLAHATWRMLALHQIWIENSKNL